MGALEKLGIMAVVREREWRVACGSQALTPTEAVEASRRLYALALEISEAEGTLPPPPPAREQSALTLLEELRELRRQGKPLGGIEARPVMKRIEELLDAAKEGA